jgi:hypothetical protein
MNFEREKKISRLLLQAQKFKEPYLKVPIELAEFAFKQHKISQVRVYLASHFIYSGKARMSDEPVQRIANKLSLSDRQVYRALKWLSQKDWIGKDADNGWMFFRGIDKVHEIQGWKYSRSALMFKDDLPHFKAFLIGALIANFIKGRGTGTDRESKRSQQSRCPVSLSIVQKLFGVSEKTAFNYRKLAEKYRYIKMEQNLPQVEGISPKDITHLKQNGIDRVDLRLFGSPDSVSVHPKQLRTDKGFIYAQLSNLITPNVLIGKRNVNRSKPFPLQGNVSKKCQWK